MSDRPTDAFRPDVTPHDEPPPYPRAGAAFRVGVVGTGRLAHALVAGLRGAGITLAGVAGRDPGRAAALAAAADAPVLTPAELLARADLTVLAVSDDALATLAETLAGGVSDSGEPDRPTGVVVHCSGALTPQVLAPLAALGHPVASWHPLQAFPRLDTGLRPGITWAITPGEGPGGRPREVLTLLEGLTRELGGVPVRIAAPNKPTYHAAAVLASNYLATLLHHASGLLGECGLDHDEALRALVPLVASTLDGIVAAGLPDGLTGPLARGDIGTVETHLRALAAHPETEALYRSVGLGTVPLLEQRGMDGNVIRRIGVILNRNTSLQGTPGLASTTRTPS